MLPVSKLRKDPSIEAGIQVGDEVGKRGVSCAGGLLGVCHCITTLRLRQFCTGIHAPLLGTCALSKVRNLYEPYIAHL